MKKLMVLFMILLLCGCTAADVSDDVNNDEQSVIDNKWQDIAAGDIVLKVPAEWQAVEVEKDRYYVCGTPEHTDIMQIYYVDFNEDDLSEHTAYELLSGEVDHDVMDDYEIMGLRGFKLKDDNEELPPQYLLADDDAGRFYAIYFDYVDTEKVTDLSLRKEIADSIRIK